MANYALTVTPKFTPFTYDELIKPIETYQKVYDTYDATYEKALEDASKFASLNAETDPEAYQRYQNYLQNIQNQRDVLFRTGLSNDSRRGFQNLRNTYATEIKPMEIAYDKKIEDIKNYDKLMMTNPQMRAVRNPHETTLSEYMSNPDLGNRYIDLNAVSKVASDAFAKAKQTYINKNNLNPYTYQMITRYGETPAAIMKGLQEATQDGDPKTRSQAAQIITMVRDSVRNQFGYDDIDNDSVKQDIDNTIYNSAWSLQGQDDIKYVENYGARQAAQNAEYDRRLALQHTYDLAKMEAQAEIKARTEQTNADGTPISYLLGNLGDDGSFTYVDSRNKKYSVKDLVIKPAYVKNAQGQDTNVRKGDAYTTQGFDKNFAEIEGKTGAGHPINNARRDELTAAKKEYVEYINKLVSIAKAQNPNYDSLSDAEKKQMLLNIESSGIATQDRTVLQGKSVTETGKQIFGNYVKAGTTLSYIPAGKSSENTGTFNTADINRVMVNPDTGVYALDNSGNKINLNQQFAQIVNPIRTVTKALDFQNISDYPTHKEAPKLNSSEGWSNLKGTNGIQIYVQNKEKTETTPGGLKVYIKTPSGKYYASDANNPIIGAASIELLSQEMGKLVLQGATNFEGNLGKKLTEYLYN